MWDIGKKGYNAIAGEVKSGNQPIIINTIVDGNIISQKVIENYSTAQSVNQRGRRV
jgi:hypothetical protein